jgi:transcriptional regulator with XRE-family HTH domain
MIEKHDCPHVRNGEPASGGAEKNLRFARPPWLIVFAFDGGTIPNYSAKMWQMLSLHFSPDDDLTQQRLIELRRRLNWSRAMASAVLAAAEGSIAKWECGTRSFSGPTRRLRNLLYHLFLEPEKARHGLDLIFWHKSGQCIDFYKSIFDEENSASQRERMEKEETIEDGCPHSDSQRSKNQREEEMLELYNSSDDLDLRQQIASDLFKEFGITVEP